ncbi:MAG TPA: hypothetical protein DD979_10930 [Gammaproteobacteria bacterium]|nr:hypothetical protein [Gammaproteobacteria bacterium]
MLGLASFAMRGPLYAALPASLLLALAVFLPPLAWLSAAVVALVFLRKGINDGLIVFAASAIAIGMFTAWQTGNFPAGVKLVAAFWLPVIVLSLVLRETVDLGKTLLAASTAGLAVVGGFFVFMDDPAAFWEQQILTQFPVDQFSSQFPMEQAALETFARQSSLMMTGAFITVMMLGALVSLIIARAWQAGLYNPGGFREEFHDLRLGKSPAILGLLMALAAVGTGLPIFMNAAPIVVALFFFQGLAVFHGVVARRQLSSGWLIGLYGLLLFLLPHTMILLGALGMADNWLNIRKRAGE